MSDIRENLKNVFQELVDTTEIDKITVSMLVRKCGISRTLFYYYYEDLSALIRDVLYDEARRISEEAEKMSNPYDAVKCFVSNAAAEFPVMRRITGSRYYEVTLGLVADTSLKFMRDLIEKNKKEDEEFTPEMDFMAEYLAYGLILYLFRHCSDADFDIEDISRKLYSTLGKMLPSKAQRQITE